MKSIFTTRRGSARSRSVALGVFASILSAIVCLRVAPLQAQESTPEFSDDNWVGMGGIPGVMDDHLSRFGTGRVSAIVSDEEGLIYLGGEFIIAGDIKATNIVMWDGSAWHSLGEELTGTVSSLAMYENQLFVGGFFESIGDLEANSIARWDGEEWTALGSGLNGGVGALVAGEDGLYAGGSFTTAGGVEVNRIARWDGSEWFPLDSGAGGLSRGLFSANVEDLEIFEGEIYVAGSFTHAGDVEVNNIAKWNGAEWTSLGSGADSTVIDMALLNGELYAVGSFRNIGGKEANRIAKWDGNEWYALEGTGFNQYASSIVAKGNDLYVGGRFWEAGEVRVNYVAKWDGNEWSSIGEGMDTRVETISFVGDDLYAGGRFTQAGGVAAIFVAKWNGEKWSPLGQGLAAARGYPSVLALETVGNEIYAGGPIISFGEQLLGGIAKWGVGGWLPLGSGVDGEVRSENPSGRFFPPKISPAVFALKEMKGDLYVGGWFSSAGAIPADNIAKWDGSSWFPLGDGFNDAVWVLYVINGELYAGGNFTASGETAVNHIAKWDGEGWQSLGVGVNEIVAAIVEYEGDLYVGGTFTEAGGAEASYVARWDGSQWYPVGSGLPGPVEALVVFKDELYAGGAFAVLGENEVNAYGIAKWNGSEWLGVGSGFSNIVYALAASEENLFAGGRFHSVEADILNNVAKWDGVSWSPLGSGMNSGTVYALEVLYDSLYAAGIFTMAGGKVSAYVARAFLDAVPPLEVVNGRATVFFREGIEEGLYEIYRSTELNDWELIATRYAGATGGIDFVDENSPEYEAFYRAVRVEP